MNSLQTPVASQAELLFSSLFPFSSISLGAQKSAHAAVRVALVPPGLLWELLSSSLKSTHPPARQNSVLDMQMARVWWIPEPPRTAGGKLAGLVRFLAEMVLMKPDSFVFARRPRAAG